MGQLRKSLRAEKRTPDAPNAPGTTECNFQAFTETAGKVAIALRDKGNRARSGCRWLAGFFRNPTLLVGVFSGKPKGKPYTPKDNGRP